MMTRRCTPIVGPRGNAGAARRAVAACALLAATAACGEFPTSPSASARGTYRGGGTSAPRPSFSLPLIGEWRRTIVFGDTFGGANVSATVWNFRPDGTFTHTVSISNLTSGAIDSEIRTGRWEADGSVLVLTFDGGFTPARFTYLFFGANLILGGVEYVRVS